MCRAGWMARRLERPPYNVVLVALANKMARTVLAVLAKGSGFDRVKWSPLELMSTESARVEQQNNIPAVTE